MDISDGKDEKGKRLLKNLTPKSSFFFTRLARVHFILKNAVIIKHSKL
jgi:hypothetical protein